MKQVITDNRLSYVYYNGFTKGIFATYNEYDKPLASIKDVENHFEIWDCPLIVKEGKFKYENSRYEKQ